MNNNKDDQSTIFNKRLRILFFVSLFLLTLFEILNVYFIMPMPGSQRMQSIDTAYFLYSSRWVFRSILGLLILIGIFSAFSYGKKWVPFVALLFAAFIIYVINFQMAADTMFYQPTHLVLKDSRNNKIMLKKLVLGVENNGVTRAYPIQLIAYHHQVLDTLGGEPVMVTYCSVCRTGRVFKPIINGQNEKFRLVGMDHFNAMFEDASTKSWWRQANGEAIKGKMQGQVLPEINTRQTTLRQWLTLNPKSLIMQADTIFKEEYKDLEKYDNGKGKSNLTKTDTASWKEKSWVVGILIGNESKAYDWNRLKKERIINDEIGGKTIVLAIAKDNKSFFAFERSKFNLFSLRNDSLITNHERFDLNGKSNILNSPQLKKIKAYQEFWHSWRTFHPNTKKY